MFHEIFFAPFKQTNTFRSPDVALLPFVGGSTHAVTTPLWTPAALLCCSLQRSRQPRRTRQLQLPTSSFVDVDFLTRHPLVFSGARTIRSSDLRSETCPEVAQSNADCDQWLPGYGYASVGVTPPAAARRCDHRTTPPQPAISGGDRSGRHAASDLPTPARCSGPARSHPTASRAARLPECPMRLRLQLRFSRPRAAQRESRLVVTCRRSRARSRGRRNAACASRPRPRSPRRSEGARTSRSVR